jgi:dihydrofolate reductase
MPKLRVHCIGVSLDGFAAGPRQTLADPSGVGGMGLHEWFFRTRTFKMMHAEIGRANVTEPGSTGIDDGFAARGFEGLGAWIVGRNMFGPVRGPWPDDLWKGWWGDVPPFHAPVFVLTHHPRQPVAMQGGTTFHFVTGGIREAFDRAMDAANGKDVRLGGGASTIRQYLTARLVDEMHLALSPILIGGGEHLLGGLDLPALGYGVIDRKCGENAMHVVFHGRRE